MELSVSPPDISFSCVLWESKATELVQARATFGNPHHPLVMCMPGSSTARGDGRHTQMPDLVADLVRHQVNVIAATGGDSAPLAAKAATKTIPIIFNSASDPIKIGLVESLSRPGGNLTGVSRISVQLLPNAWSFLLRSPPMQSWLGFCSTPIPNQRAWDQGCRDCRACARASDTGVSSKQRSNRVGVCRHESDEHRRALDRQ